MEQNEQDMAIFITTTPCVSWRERRRRRERSEDPLPPTPPASEASEVPPHPSPPSSVCPSPASVSILLQSLSSASHSLSYPLPCHFFSPPPLYAASSLTRVFIFFIFFSFFMRAPTPARCYLPLSAASLRSNGSIWCIWQTSGITCHPVVVALAAARLAGRRRRRSCLDSNSVGSLLVGS